MKVLFVCTGNTCRSCMAEVIFNQMSNLDNIEAYSAGIAVVQESKTSKYTAALIEDNFKINISNRKAIQFTKEMLEENDLILTMTSYIRNVLSENFPKYKNKIYTLNEYIELKEDINDPYGGDAEVYKKTFNMLKKSIELLLGKIREDNGIV
ncbi:low molecular weight protein arginine phosphatase [Clostridium aestuarii]|uniref:Low molecular weight protein arginine phosphatase n=1 Tax=Clostridium aestuarii TaxID=338193 RepID=A0ABT4D617_9CLOT|nr:low molecular weight protein arginine phosphatase [Clostridium aestuarii]MCY6485615.1 low molecular weight protein arginine phosphatase [Clostridium aestuarii]